MIVDTETPSRRPPPHLESLKGRRDQSVTTKEDMEERMRQAEERRNKRKEEELKVRLRTKSAGVCGPNTAAKTGEGDVFTPVEVLQAPDTPPSPRGIQQDPPDTDPTQTQGGGDGGVRESGGEGVRSGVSGQLLSASLEMENDSTFQQIEQTVEMF
ncbi:unnamed protein product [Coregonus sp. 'balchen']|nr:unnamed protein product [Coregonus sp. 'balchen']